MQSQYILLTAAKNEAEYIGAAIAAVLRQGVLPLAWFIVDDGSTDETARIVGRFASQHPFIRLIAAGGAGERSFGSKDKAINAAYGAAKPLDFDIIGILDADIAPERSDYYETILGEFQSRPRLGIAGGYIYERSNGVWQCRKGNSADSVAGGIQMFRRACFEQLGGYIPMHHGGEDWLAQIAARMAGWQVLACPELHALHYRPTSSAGGRWRGLFRLGMMDASFGSHPVFELFKCCRRVVAPPVLLGGAVRLGGYLWWKISGHKPLISAEQVAFLRREQMVKLRKFLQPLAPKPAPPAKPLSV